ncbi:uncharacterized protein [Hyperolius riggenbachi]|uniref:uncharacterized protein n=1 Tax=Hyperolius riggenbachi TaxID=752182 RepID=UPI0035A30012
MLAVSSIQRLLFWLQQQACRVMGQKTCNSVMLLPQRTIKDEKDSSYSYIQLTYDGGTYCICIQMKISVQDDVFQCRAFECYWISLGNLEESRKMATMRWSGQRAPVEQQKAWKSCITVEASRNGNTFPLFKSPTDRSLEDWNQKYADLRPGILEIEIYGYENIFRVPAFAYCWINTQSSVGFVPMVVKWSESYLHSIEHRKHWKLPNLNISPPNPTKSVTLHHTQYHSCPVHESCGIWKTWNNSGRSTQLPTTKNEISGGYTSSTFTKGNNNHKHKLCISLLLLAMLHPSHGYPLTPQGGHSVILQISQESGGGQTVFKCDLKIDNVTRYCYGSCDGEKNSHHSSFPNTTILEWESWCNQWKKPMEDHYSYLNYLNHFSGVHVLTNYHGLILDKGFNVIKGVYVYELDGKLLSPEEMEGLQYDVIRRHTNSRDLTPMETIEKAEQFVAERPIFIEQLVKKEDAASDPPPPDPGRPASVRTRTIPVILFCVWAAVLVAWCAVNVCRGKINIKKSLKSSLDQRKSILLF